MRYDHRSQTVATFRDEVDGIDYQVTVETSVYRPHDAVPTVTIGALGRNAMIEFDAETPEGLRSLSALIDGLTEARRRVQVAVEERYGHLTVGDVVSFEPTDTVDEQCNLLLSGTGKVCNRARHADQYHVAIDPNTDEVLAVQHGRPE